MLNPRVRGGQKKCEPTFGRLGSMTPTRLTSTAFGRKRKTRNPLAGAGSDVVEVRRLELLTPYMRSKTSTKSEKTKKPRNSGKNQ
jgi:hypothetical protein